MCASFNNLDNNSNISNQILQSSIRSAQESKVIPSMDSTASSLATNRIDIIFQLIEQVDNLVVKLGTLAISGKNEPVYLSLKDLFIIRSSGTEIKSIKKKFDRALTDIISNPIRIDSKTALKLHKKIDVLDHNLIELEDLYSIFEDPTYLRLIDIDMDEHYEELEKLEAILQDDTEIVDIMVTRLRLLLESIHK